MTIFVHLYILYILIHIYISLELALGDDDGSVSVNIVPGLVRAAGGNNPAPAPIPNNQPNPTLNPTPNPNPTPVSLPPNSAPLRDDGTITPAGDSSRSRSISMTGFNNMTIDLFDVLDTIVYRFLETELWTEFQTSLHWGRYWQFIALSELPVGEDDFSLFRVLGRGGFGLVNMCKRAASGKLFAMKQMNKRRVKMKKAESLCLNERNILAAIDSPYVVCLKYAFATGNELYLILDLMMGGDLGFHLTRRKRFNDIETKFFATRTLMGLVALHEKNIVYRDLKPENILMDNDGYTRISDLGLASSIDNRIGMVGTCGTRGYWAPEMLRRDEAGRREKYFQVVDWFSFGCLVYEFVYGCGPFRTLKARQYGQNPPKPPSKMTKEERDRSIDAAILEMEPDVESPFFQSNHSLINLIQLLLKKNPNERLGYKGHDEIMKHAYFKGTDWDQVMFLRPPWRPARNINMAPQQEIGTFADEKQSNRMVLLPEDHQVYDGWSFINVKAFEEYLRYEEAVSVYMCIVYVCMCMYSVYIMCIMCYIWT